MCGQMSAAPKAAVLDATRELGLGNVIDETGGLWPQGDAYPRSQVPVITVSPEDALVMQMLNWGFTVPGRTNVIFNTRIETAASLPLWQDAIASRRCLVPARSFFERHRTEHGISPTTGKAVKQLERFDAPEGDLLFLAGIWQGTEFSVMTTAPNASVAPVHDRMPLVVRADEVRTWLFGDYASLADRSTIALDAHPVFPAAPHHEQPTLF